MKILLVEDDSFDADVISDGLREALDARVRVICTEKEFLDSLELIASDPPDVIVLDVMLRWTDASPRLSQVVPVEVKQQGFYLAGFRCIGYLKRNPRTAAIPYVLYTGLGQENFEGEEVVTKSEDLEPLVRAISKRCRGRMGT